MLSGSQSISTYSRPNTLIWCVMAFHAGLLNVGGLLSCQTVVSHVTGFIALAAIEVNASNLAHAFDFLTIIISFMFGSIISGTLVDSQLRKNKMPRYYLVFGLIFLLTLFILLAGQSNLFGPFNSNVGHIGTYVLALMISLICGIQNGMVTLVSKSVVRTTHITGLVTDLGIGLSRVVLLKDLKSAEDEHQAIKMRITIILAFFLGSLVAVPVFKQEQYLGFMVPAMISGALFFTTLYFQVMKRPR